MPPGQLSRKIKRIGVSLKEMPFTADFLWRHKFMTKNALSIVILTAVRQIQSRQARKSAKLVREPLPVTHARIMRFGDHDLGPEYPRCGERVGNS